MALVTIAPTQIGMGVPIALAGGAIEIPNGTLITGGALRPLLFYVTNTGDAGTITVAAGTSIDEAPAMGAGALTLAIVGTSGAVLFRVESARHSQGGNISITYSAGMAGFIYAFETNVRSL